MRPTRRRSRQRTEGLNGPSVADFYRALLTGEYPAIAAPTYRDYEEYARGIRAS
ncbi:hypothetical protein K1X22_01285 [Mycolicibacterium farcinogenes]|uniref:hypothetical protein n=1 Tax=Mycolicibacterium farcinogenes TaxID=1802 RepID=UPI001C8D758E|nr:hypothetical protein [Mycolicibacterium farcinogenes]QZH60493.1 hypothetical protein K1X22_01285 [Mycolicibacterium farcinogenes]